MRIKNELVSLTLKTKKIPYVFVSQVYELLQPVGLVVQYRGLELVMFK